MRRPPPLLSCAALALALAPHAAAQGGPPKTLSPGFTAVGPGLLPGGGRTAFGSRSALARVEAPPGAAAASSPGYRLDGALSLAPIIVGGLGPELLAATPFLLSGALPGAVGLFGSGFTDPGSGPATAAFGPLAPVPVAVVDDQNASAAPPAGLDGALNPLGRVDVLYANALGDSTLAGGAVFGPALELSGIPTVGETVDLTVHGPSSEVFLVYLSKGLLPGPIPLDGIAGALVVQPSETLLLTVASNGSTATPLAVPDEPAFAGVARALQAIALGGPSGPAFSNALQFTFLP